MPFLRKETRKQILHPEGFINKITENFSEFVDKGLKLTLESIEQKMDGMQESREADEKKREQELESQRQELALIKQEREQELELRRQELELEKHEREQKLELKRQRQQTNLDRLDRLTRVFIWSTFITLAIIFLSGFHLFGFTLSEALLITLISATLGSIVGLIGTAYAWKPKKDD